MGNLDIKLDRLDIGYGDNVVVSGIDATLPEGKISVILGGSGSGKSTLIRHILGLNPPLSGGILLGGKDIAAMGAKELFCLRRRMGVLFQDGALLGSMTLFDNVALPLKEHTRLRAPGIQDLVMDKLKLVGLDEFAQYFPNQLSGGMRKRAGLARAMVMDPAILFCDEPTSGLDPVNSAGLDRLLISLKEKFNMGMVVVSHDLASTFAIADYIMVLGEGRVLFQGLPEDLRKTADPYLRSFLDRQAAKEDNLESECRTLDDKVFKRDCSKFWQA